MSERVESCTSEMFILCGHPFTLLTSESGHRQVIASLGQIGSITSSIWYGNPFPIETKEDCALRILKHATEVLSV